MGATGPKLQLGAGNGPSDAGRRRVTFPRAARVGAPVTPGQAEEALFSSASPETQRPGTGDELSGAKATGPAGRLRGPGVQGAMELVEDGFWGGASWWKG